MSKGPYQYRANNFILLTYGYDHWQKHIQLQWQNSHDSLSVQFTAKQGRHRLKDLIKPNMPSTFYWKSLKGQRIFRYWYLHIKSVTFSFENFGIHWKLFAIFLEDFHRSFWKLVSNFSFGTLILVWNFYDFQKRYERKVYNNWHG